MLETLQTDGLSKHKKQESLLDRLKIERHKGRRRAAGRGVLSLVSRMHFLGLHGRHVAGGEAQSRAPQPVSMRHEGGSHTVQAPGTSAEIARPQPSAAVEAPAAPAFVPEASAIRPEVPAEALVPAAEYVGEHRRPETLEESDIRNARLAAKSLALPSEAHRDPDAWAAAPTGLPVRTPGELYNPAEDVSSMAQRTLSERGIVPHDNTANTAGAAPHVPAPQNHDWFGGANARRH